MPEYNNLAVSVSSGSVSFSGASGTISLANSSSPIKLSLASGAVSFQEATIKGIICDKAVNSCNLECVDEPSNKKCNANTKGNKRLCEIYEAELLIYYVRQEGITDLIECSNALANALPSIKNSYCGNKSPDSGQSKIFNEAFTKIIHHISPITVQSLVDSEYKECTYAHWCPNGMRDERIWLNGSKGFLSQVENWWLWLIRSFRYFLSSPKYFLWVYALSISVVLMYFSAVAFSGAKFLSLIDNLEKNRIELLEKIGGDDEPADARLNGEKNTINGPANKPENKGPVKTELEKKDMRQKAVAQAKYFYLQIKWDTAHQNLKEWLANHSNKYLASLLLPGREAVPPQAFKKPDCSEKNSWDSLKAFVSWMIPFPIMEKENVGCIRDPESRTSWDDTFVFTKKTQDKDGKGIDKIIKREKFGREQRHLRETAVMLVYIWFHHILLFTYGALGACIHAIKKVLQELKDKTYTLKSQATYFLEMTLGALAGGCIGWFFSGDIYSFIDIQGKTADIPTAPFENYRYLLSPLLYAFIGGYNSKVLFTVMDRIARAILGEDAQAQAASQKLKSAPKMESDTPQADKGSASS